MGDAYVCQASMGMDRDRIDKPPLAPSDGVSHPAQSRAGERHGRYKRRERKAISLVGDAGAQLLAPRNLRRWILSENLHMPGDKPNPEHKAFIEKFVAPMLSPDAVGRSGE